MRRELILSDTHQFVVKGVRRSTERKLTLGVKGCLKNRFMDSSVR